jgi:hypothetical protein
MKYYHLSVQDEKSQGSVLMNHYRNQRTNQLNNDINDFRNTISLTNPSATSDLRQNVGSFQSMSSDSSVNQASESPSQIKIDAWIKEERSTMKLPKKSSSEKEKTTFFK